MSIDQPTGFDKVPDHYATDEGREVVDCMRDHYTDREFAAIASGMALKYEFRAGKKTEGDDDKALWWRTMEGHVRGDNEDPRVYRDGHAAYERTDHPHGHRRKPVLDHGYLRVVEAWGCGDTADMEAGIIEAARQSTQGSFRGWGKDQRLLEYLYRHNHATPFEFAGAVIEVQAPIFVFRQWHRHRTQSYNEMSARYAPLPEAWYTPTVERLMMGGGKNKQAGGVKGADALTLDGAQTFRMQLDANYQLAWQDYEDALSDGVPKELARGLLGPNHYSRMRASANLRNWLGFLTLRCDPHAQWEIRQYADTLMKELRFHFPRVIDLWLAGR